MISDLFWGQILKEHDIILGSNFEVIFEVSIIHRVAVISNLFWGQILKKYDIIQKELIQVTGMNSEFKVWDYIFVF